ncbi:MAG: FG-GAP repeat protein [Deltaproteobacteria bacterium]|nr:FG-GAP repeat protein [Deltaproteobacteria bacterium]
MTASDGAAIDHLGTYNSVSISGGTVLSGAPLADLSGMDNAGAAYIFDTPATSPGDGSGGGSNGCFINTAAYGFQF